MLSQRMYKSVYISTHFPWITGNTQAESEHIYPLSQPDCIQEGHFECSNSEMLLYIKKHLFYSCKITTTWNYYTFVCLLH